MFQILTNSFLLTQKFQNGAEFQSLNKIHSQIYRSAAIKVKGKSTRAQTLDENFIPFRIKSRPTLFESMNEVTPTFPLTFVLFFQHFLFTIFPSKFLSGIHSSIFYSMYDFLFYLGVNLFSISYNLIVRVLSF